MEIKVLGTGCCGSAETCGCAAVQCGQVSDQKK